jgi:GntR family transcriptional regulator
MEVTMADKRKAQPAGAGRAVGNTVGAGGVDSAFDHPHCSTEVARCQEVSGEEVSCKSVGECSASIGKSARLSGKDGKMLPFRAAMPQHIGDIDLSLPPDHSPGASGVYRGRPIAWTDVYVKIKVAFRQEALRLLKGAKLSCFICLALHIDGKGECYPSIDTIVRETGYSRATVCSALDELVELGFIEKKRRKHDSTLYTVNGYVWYGSKSKPTLLGEAQSKETLLSPPESKASERLPTKRLATLPKDEPSVKEQPLEKKEREISNSKLPSSPFSTENYCDDELPESPLIGITVEKLSRTFGDLHHLKSNITRARRLWGKTELEEEEFVEIMEKAAAITKGEISKGNVQRDKRMAYFFAVLEDQLGLRG